MSHARMKTAFLHFSDFLPLSMFLIAAAVGKPGFCGISTFLICFGLECVFVSTSQCHLKNYHHSLLVPGYFASKLILVISSQPLVLSHHNFILR